MADKRAGVAKLVDAADLKSTNIAGSSPASRTNFLQIREKETHMTTFVITAGKERGLYWTGETFSKDQTKAKPFASIAAAKRAITMAIKDSHPKREKTLAVHEVEAAAAVVKPAKAAAPAVAVGKKPSRVKKAA